MFFLRFLLTAATVAVFLTPAAVVAVESAERLYTRLQGVSASDHRGEQIEVDIALPDPADLNIQIVGDRVRVRYRMVFNQVAEGWNWHPLADSSVEDYYHFKYLPLQSVPEERGSYAGEDKIGTMQVMAIRWRYDYFLAFENLYDYYARSTDDDAGFSADLPAALAGHVGMRARATLIEPVTRESTTFWKAIHGQPTDFTLKKRYLLGRLDAVDFVDTSTGRVLCRILPGQAACQGQ